MSFEKVINGIVKYLNAKIYSGMNDWQEVIARVAVSRMVANSNQLKDTLMNNAFFKTFAVIDLDGNVDVEGVLRDLKDQISAKGKIVVALPIFGTFTFTPGDVDELHRYIAEG